MDTYRIHNLTFCYPGQSEQALDQISFAVKPGEFVTICGPSGSGKSTLLRQFKTVLAPHGTLTGEILFEGKPLAAVSQREQSAGIGFVLQNPESQIVTDKVWHELAFGLESLGFDTPAIRRRVAEMASFFGIESWFHREVTTLSGGQKQLLNLASIMAMQPSVLILDEPTSLLDPIAAGNFLAAVGKINRELGTTVLLSEHRLEEVFPLSDRVLVLDQGRLLLDGTAREIGEGLRRAGHGMFCAMPAPMRIWAAVPDELPCPVTVRDGRNWLDRYAAQHVITPVENAAAPLAATEEPVLTLDEVWFRYERESPDVAKGLSLRVNRGEFLAILGGNGTGKNDNAFVAGGAEPAVPGHGNGTGHHWAFAAKPAVHFCKEDGSRRLG